MTDADVYFAMHASEEPGELVGRWSDINADVTPVEMVPGLVFRPVLGENVMMNVVYFDPHTEAPLHAHMEEQITFVLEGECEFEVSGDKRMLKPGMAVVIPPHAPHAARTFDTRCTEIDIFHPPRQALLALLRPETISNTE